MVKKTTSYFLHNKVNSSKLFVFSLLPISLIFSKLKCFCNQSISCFFLAFSLILVLSTTIFGQVVTTLPSTFGGDWISGTYPSGWSRTIGGTAGTNMDGTGSNGARINGSGHNITVDFGCNQVDSVSFWLIKTNTSYNGEVKIQKSSDGTNWTDISIVASTTIGSTLATPYTQNISGNPRYIRFFQSATSSSGRVDLDGISFTGTSCSSITMSNGSSTTCLSSFFDSGIGGDYQSGENYSYTIYPATAGTQVRLTFTSFSTEDNFDGMMIYNGNSVSAPLISSGLGVGSNSTTCPAGSWRGTGSPGTITSTAADGSLTIVFKSDVGTVSSGWLAFISCYTPAAPVCVLLPSSPSNGATNVNASTTLTWPAATDASSYDVYLSTNQTLVNSSSASVLAANVTSTSYTPTNLQLGATYYWKIVSKNNQGSASDCSTWSFTLGSAINMTNGSISACSVNTFYDSGGSGANYSNDESYTLTIYPAASSTQVRLTFTSFSTEDNFDGMMIYNGNSVSAPLISSGLGGGSNSTTCPAGSWRGTGSPGTITSSAADGSLTIVFNSDGGAVSTGWVAAISCYSPAPPLCLSLPTSPTNTATGVNGITTLTWPSSLDATSYDVYLSTNQTLVNSSSASVLVANVTGTSFTPSNLQLGATYYWKVIPKNSQGNASSCSTWSFTVGTTINMTNGSISACSGTFYDSGGSGANYSNDESYTLTIYPATAGTQVRLTFTSFSTENDFDGMMIYNGNSTSAPLISSGLGAGSNTTTCPAGSWRGTGSPGTITSSAADGSLTIVFKSDGGAVSTGWVAAISCYSPAPPLCVSLPTSPTNTATGVNGITTLTWPSSLDATSYDVYLSTNQSSVNSSSSSVLVANVTGTSYSPTNLQLGATYYWKVIPKNSQGSASSCSTWSFTVGTTINMTNGSISACSGTFYDSGGSGANYSNDESYTLTIYPATTGTQVRLTFTSFSTENAWDGMMIYNGNSTSAPLISSGLGVGSNTTTCPAGSWRGTGSPGTITSSASDGSLTIVFKSDGATISSGWVATISCYTPSIPGCVIGSVNPLPNATGIVVAPTLTWPNVSDATSYDVYFSTNQTLVNTSNASVLVANVTGLSYSTGLLNVSTTYYWKIVPKNLLGAATECVTYSFTTSSTTGIPNDFCANATNLPCGTYNLSGTTTGAISETPPNSCANVSSYGVWYTFAGDGNPTTLTIQGNSFDVGFGLYSGACNNLSLIACKDDFNSTGSETHTITTVIEQNYFVYVSYYDNTSNLTGSFSISRTCQPSCTTNDPAGNTCAASVPICDLNGYCGNTSPSYTANSWPELTNAFSTNGNGASIENNSFISFVAGASTVNLEVYVTSCVYGDGIQMMIFSAATCGSGPVTSFVVWNPEYQTNGIITATGLTPGNTYYLMIDGYAGDNCSYIIGATALSGVTIPVNASADVSICAGSSTTLTASGGNGTYTWSPSSSLSSSTGSSVVASPTQLTTYTVSSSTGNPLCPVTTENQVTVTVNSNPIASITSTTLCAGVGNSATITATGGGSYLWSPGGQTSSSIDISSAGNYSVLVTNNGCSSTANTTVSVSNPPNILQISPP